MSGPNTPDRRRPDAAPSGRAASLRRLLEGPPPTLPVSIDRLAERWAASGPRMRLAVGVLAAVVLVAVSGVGAARSPWGPPTTAVVGTRDLPAGAVLTSGDLRQTEWPALLVPHDAITDVAAVVGQQLSRTVHADTPLTARDITDGGPARDLAQGSVALPIPLPSGAAVRPGQTVDVLGGELGPGGRRLAAAARILAVDGPTVWIAVRRDEAPDVAAAAGSGRITLALLPPAR